MKTQSYYNPSEVSESNVESFDEGVFINCAGALNHTNKIEQKSLRNDYYLMYMARGELDVFIEDKNFTFSGGSFLIISPHTRYSYASKEGERTYYLWIHFTGAFAKEFIERFGFSVNTPISIAYPCDMPELWSSLFKEFIINDEYFNDVTKGILFQIFTSFKRAADKEKDFLNSIMYIHSNLNKQLKISELSKIEKISESAYRKEFKCFTGMSPLEYIIGQRIDNSKSLLETTNLSVFEISQRYGFRDVYYFSKLFKKKTGLSPAMYRKQRGKKG